MCIAQYILCVVKHVNEVNMEKIIYHDFGKKTAQ